jgi:hypothetical protein
MRSMAEGYRRAGASKDATNIAKLRFWDTIIGRIYEDRGPGTPEDLRWFWLITVYVDPPGGHRDERKGSDLRGSEGAVSDELGEREGTHGGQKY